MKKQSKNLTIWNPWEPDKYVILFPTDPVEPKYFAVPKPTKSPTKGVVEGWVGEVDPIQYQKYINPYNPALLPELPVQLVGFMETPGI